MSVHKMNLEGQDVAIFAGDFGEKDGKPSETQFKYPTSLTCDEKGNVYILDYIVNALRMISADEISCTVESRLGQLVRFDSNIAYDKTKHVIYLTAENCVHQFDIKAHQISEFLPAKSVVDGKADFQGICVDPTTSNVFVINYMERCIYHVDRTTRVAKKVEARNKGGEHLDFSSPVRLRADNNGILYVADQKQGIFKIVAKKRLKWSVKKLLWIGKNKHNPEECLLALLPQEILLEIIKHLEG
eukprot:CAMPEP_0168576200 /NCGR_PEP_ID=MMETSP0413-20121227/20108_1 /TAXON_ID=136452 /ORGANISM="Filamoeba nolandi, Strain NC-AS-23-1" /LENGTH=243 /DNA_ID=CAMNT_0008609835 /DNA_START=264 /DNA_END=995 /DNA_ORIENTATION=-